jgi:hypothetical protein
MYCLANDKTLDVRRWNTNERVIEIQKPAGFVWLGITDDCLFVVRHSFMSCHTMDKISLATGETIATTTEPSGILCLSQDQTMIAYALSNGIRIMRTEDLSQLVCLSGFIDPTIDDYSKGLDSLYFSWDSRYVFYTTDSGLHRIDIATGEINVYDDDCITDVSPVGDLAWACTGDGYILNYSNGERIIPEVTETRGLFMYDGSAIVLVGDSEYSTPQIINSETGKLIRTLDFEIEMGTTRVLAVSPNSDSIIIAVYPEMNDEDEDVNEDLIVCVNIFTDEKTIIARVPNANECSVITQRPSVNVLM